MNIQSFTDIGPIDDWDVFKKDGDQFLSTAVGAFEKKKKAFSPESIYNLTAMAIEKFVMSFLMLHGDLAENHTMQDLMFALERHLGKQPELAEKLHYMDSFQEICDPVEFTIQIPTEADLEKMIGIGKYVQELLSPTIDKALTQ